MAAYKNKSSNFIRVFTPLAAALSVVLSTFSLFTRETSAADGEGSHVIARIESDATHGYTHARDTKVSHLGRPSLKISSTSNTQPAKYFEQLFEEFRAEPYRGKRVRFRGFIKSAMTSGWAGLSLRIDGNDTTIAYADMQNRAVKGNTNWRECATVLDVPSDAKRIALGFELHGGGTAWLSDLKFETVSASIPTTPVAMDDEKYPVDSRAKSVTTKFEWTDNKTASSLESLFPVGWGYENDHGVYQFPREPGERCAGQPSACVEALDDVAPSSTRDGYGQLTQIVNSHNFNGRRWRFRAKVKTEKVSHWSGLWMRVDGDDKVLAFDNMVHRPIRGTNDWTEYSVVLDIPKNSYSFRLGLVQSGAGKTWISDCHFEQVDDSVKPTAPNITPVPIPRPEVRSTPTLTFGVL